LLETTIEGARAILLNIAGGYDLGMLEVNEAAEQIEQKADRDAIVILGTTIKEELHDEIIVTVIATGFEERERDELHSQTSDDSLEISVNVGPSADNESDDDSERNDGEDGGASETDARNTGLNNEYDYIPPFLRPQQ
jgi:cell division protein FtsZ